MYIYYCMLIISSLYSVTGLVYVRIRIIVVLVSCAENFGPVFILRVFLIVLDCQYEIFKVLTFINIEVE